MKKYSVLIIFVITLGFLGCSKKIDTSAKDPVWDREVCARCSMQVSDRLHSAQIINPKDGARFYFDDLGCAALWLNDTDLPWKNDAIIYISDGAKGGWVKSTDAVFAHDFITPMSFGVAAFKDKTDIENGKTIITYNEAVELFKNIRNERMQRKAAMNKSEDNVSDIKNEPRKMGTQKPMM